MTADPFDLEAQAKIEEDIRYGTETTISLMRYWVLTMCKQHWYLLVFMNLTGILEIT